jgi:hypothetical protein
MKSARTLEIGGLYGRCCPYDAARNSRCICILSCRTISPATTEPLTRNSDGRCRCWFPFFNDGKRADGSVAYEPRLLGA